MNDEKLNEIHFKVGEISGMLKNWEKNCQNTHKNIDLKILGFEKQINFFLWALLGVTVSVLVKTIF